MKKALVVAGGLAAVLVLAFFALSFFLGSIVTAGVNRFGPQLTGTTVTLAGARISPLDGRGALTGLVVGNPPGWSDNKLCALGEVRIDVAPFSLLGDHIVVNEIVIEAPEFNYETKLIASNVGDLLKAIETTIGGGKSGTAANAGGKPVKFEVKRFRLENGTVRIGAVGAGITMPMPPLVLTDLGTKEGGITPDQLVFAVMKSVTGSVIGATASAAGEIGKTSGAAAAEGLKKTGEAIKGFFGGKK